MRILAVALISVVTLASSTRAEELPFLGARVKTLVTFKDGTVFVLKEGRATVGPSGKVLTAPIQDAAFGTVGVNCLTKVVRYGINCFLRLTTPLSSNISSAAF